MKSRIVFLNLEDQNLLRNTDAEDTVIGGLSNLCRDTGTFVAEKVDQFEKWSGWNIPFL